MVFTVYKDNLYALNVILAAKLAMVLKKQIVKIIFWKFINLGLSCDGKLKFFNNICEENCEEIYYFD